MIEIGQPAPISYPAISIGRSELATRIASVLRKPSVNLLTLTGPGGIGKTHLALEIARDFQLDPAAQVTFLSLADTETQADAARSISKLLDQHPPDQSALSRFALAHHSYLVILDNLEHLTAIGPHLGNVLTRHPGLKLLATSRHPLDIQIEHLWKIPPLETPDGVSVASLDDLLKFGGCRLFLAIAAMVAPGSALGDEHAPTIASLCNRVGGSPLAIHIAARQLRHHSLDELDYRVENLLDIGMVGAQDVPQRHQSLRASISWSYKLLNADERAGFCQLGAFPESFSSEAAVTLIAQGIDGQSTSVSLSTARRVLTSLVDQHLVQRERTTVDGGMLLRLDPPVREYARERLSADSGYSLARRALSLWCVEFVETAAARSDRDDRIAAESANLAEARAWVIDSGEWALGFRLVDTLYSYWLIRGISGEECEWLEQLLDVAPESIPIEHELIRARIMNMLGLVSHTHANFDAAERAYLSALGLRRKLDDQAGVLDTLHNLALLAFSRGDLDLAEQRFTEPIALAREVGNQRSLASSLCYLGSIRNERGNRDGAREAISEAGSILRLGSLPRDHAQYAICMGDILWNDNLKSEALEQWTRADSQYTALGATHSRAAVSLRLGLAARDARQLSQAASHNLATLGFLDSQPDPRLLAETLIESAAVAVLAGRFRWAGTAIGASDGVLFGIGAIHLPRVEIERARSLRTIRQALGDQTTDATLLVGRGMTTEDMIAGAETCARKILDEPPHSDAVYLDELSAPDLTPREHDVVRLLAAGYTNREIGEVLSLGHRTVATHVSNLLAKFGVATRSAAAGEAVRLGLAQPQHPPTPQA